MKKQKERNPIYLPDGTEVHVGLFVYVRDFKELKEERHYRKSHSKTHIIKWSGKSRFAPTIHKVVRVDESASSRSFTIRSTKGCESTYSVKGSCINGVYGSLKSVKKAHQEMNADDIIDMNESIEKQKRYILESKAKIAKAQKAIRLLKKSKLELCEC